MDDDRRLDEHLAQSLDALLSLASAATVAGRPELALAANAALDPLLVFLEAPDAGGLDPNPDPATERPHAQH